MTRRSRSFRYFQPSKNTLGPHTMVWLHVSEVSQVPSGRGDHGAPGHHWDFSLPLRLPATAAGAAHGVPALLQRTACIPTAWGWSTWLGEADAPIRGSSGVHFHRGTWARHQGLCAAVKMTLIFSPLLAKVRWWEGQRRSQSM